VGLRFDPSGGQFQQAINKIIEAESQPIRSLEGRKKTQEQKLKLFNEFKGMFSDFKKEINEISNVRKLRELKVDLGDGEGFINVTVDKEVAQTGTFNIEIDRLAGRTGAITNGFENPDEKSLGIGFIAVSTVDQNYEIFIDEEESSLHGVARKINDDPNAPITASVIRDVYDPDNPWKLIFNAKNDGELVEVETPELYFMDGNSTIWIDNDREAQNAFLTVNGFEVDAESNDISNFLQGVNLQLLKERPDSPITVTISEDFEKITGKVDAVVKKINDVLDFINKQNQVDDSSDTSSTFTGDTGLTNIEYRLRNLMHEGFPVHWKEDGEYDIFNLNKLGISFNRSGNLTFDKNKFNKLMEEDFGAVSESLAGEYGFAHQLDSVISGWTRPVDGFLSSREKSLKRRIQNIDDQINRKTDALERRAQALTQRFARLQGSLASMQAQQAYVQANLGGGGDLLGQLLG
tara:strand:- start:1546 stop:2934 length:1389 start_codon:yes stop_codon:yes gene_type:complete